MRLIGIAAAAGIVLLLAGCSIKADVKPTPTHTTAAAIAPTPTAEPADTVPLCSSLVGQPTEKAVDPSGQVHCAITPGATGMTVVKMNCDPVGETGVTVWGWYNTDATSGDQTVYAGKDGGTIAIASPDHGDMAIVANYLAAVHCP